MTFADIAALRLPIKRPRRSNTKQVSLLPPYDEYTVAYVDRSAAIDPAMLSVAQSGIGANVIVDGRIAGTWKRKVEKDQVHISVRLPNSNSATLRKERASAACRYGKFLRLKTVLGQADRRLVVPRNPVYARLSASSAHSPFPT